MSAQNNFLMNRELIKACEENDLQAVTALLDKGADPSIYRSEPVRIAIKNNNIEMVKAFLFNAYSPNSDASLAFNEAIKNERPEILKVLINHENPSMAVLSTVKKVENDEIKSILNTVFKNQLVR